MPNRVSRKKSTYDNTYTTFDLEKGHKGHEYRSAANDVTIRWRTLWRHAGVWHNNRNQEKAWTTETSVRSGTCAKKVSSFDVWLIATSCVTIQTKVKLKKKFLRHFEFEKKSVLCNKKKFEI